MKRRLGWLVILLLVAGGAGWLIYRATRPRSLGTTATVYRGTIGTSLDALGTVQVQREMDVSALVSGRVQRIAVAVGDQVISGTLLLELVNPDAQDTLAQAESALSLRQLELEEALKAPDQATLDLAVARLRQATVMRQRAQQDYDAIQDEPNAETSDEAVALEAAKLDYETAQAQYDSAMQGTSDLQLEQLRANLADAQRTLERSRQRVAQLRVYAPMDGTVMQINPQVGENVYAYNALVQIADLTGLEVRADINELDVPAVAAGQSATFSLDAFPGESFAGQVVSLLPGPSTTRGMTTYVAVIAFDPGEHNVRPGMGANVTITTQTVEDVLLIPRGAVRTVGSSQVVSVAENGRATDIVVITGLSGTDEVQVISGLEEGQEVLVN